MKFLFGKLVKNRSKYVDPIDVIKNIVDEFGNQVNVGDQEDIGEVSEGIMSRIHEGVEYIFEEEKLEE